MFKIYGGANKFKQWTKDNKLIMDELPIGADVMFYNDPNEDDPLITEVYEIHDEEGNAIRVCDVPNIFLTETKKIKVRIPKRVRGLYGTMHSIAGQNEKYFEVDPAEKPSDYVYEKTVTNTIDPKRLPEGVPYKEVTVVNEPLNMVFEFGWQGQCTQIVAGVLGKVSDVILSEEDIKKIIIGYTSTTGGSGRTIAVADIWDDLVSTGFTDDSGVYLYTDISELGAIVRDCAAFSAFLSNKLGIGIEFTSPGIYNSISHYGYISSITTAEPVEQRTEIKKPISIELLPNGYPYADDAVIEFDGDTTGKVSVSDKFYKISDAVLTETEIKRIMISVKEGTVPITEAGAMTVTSDYIGIGNTFYFVKTPGVNVTVSGTEYVFPETGVYAVDSMGAFKLKYETIHPIAAEFLPTSVPAIKSASVGQFPKVAAVDENGVPTKWEAGEAGGQQIQSDWNQNDENAPDYVKNRLCYKYTEFIDAVSETTLNATTASEGYYTATIQGNNYHLGTESASVVYDGTTYENVPASHNESWAGGALQSADTIGSIPEYPFKIVMRNGAYENNLTLYAETQGEHTFCIKKPVNKVKKLDNEYIPNNVASLPGTYYGDTAGYPILYVSGFEEDDNGYKRASDFSALSMSSIEGWTFTLEDGTTVMKRVGIFR